MADDDYSIDCCDGSSSDMNDSELNMELGCNDIEQLESLSFKVMILKILAYFQEKDQTPQKYVQYIPLENIENPFQFICKRRQYLLKTGLNEKESGIIFLLLDAFYYDADLNEKIPDDHINIDNLVDPDEFELDFWEVAKEMGYVQEGDDAWFKNVIEFYNQVYQYPDEHLPLWIRFLETLGDYELKIYDELPPINLKHVSNDFENGETQKIIMVANIKDMLE
jgi:hypothetical protein